jgi:predicted nucleotidyltransferase
VATDFEAIKEIAKIYANEVKERLPVDKAYLFGSYANGTATELSDVDVAFFFRDYGGKERIDMGIQLLRIARDYDAYFEPLAFEMSDITRGNPFVNEILRTGTEI